MKKHKIIKNFLITSIMFLVCCVAFSSESKAAKTGFITKIPAPRKYFTIDNSKLSDITLSIVGSTTIKPENVKLYEVDSKGENPKSIQFSESITTNKKNHTYKLSHEKFLKGQTHYLYIKIKDDKDNIHESKFTIFVSTRKENGTEIKYYNVDDSPRLKGWIASDTKLYFNVKDLEDIKSVKIQDMNNGNKEILSFTNLENKDLITVDTNKFKAKNEIFNLKVISQEKDDTYAQKSIETISFKLSHEITRIYPESIKLNKTSDEIDAQKTKTLTLKATLTPKDANRRDITWKSSDTKIAKVDSKGNVSFIGDGTVTITAKTENGLTATCKIKVILNPIMNIPYLCQNDAKYASYRFPIHTGSSIAANGCGIVATTMVIQYLTNSNVTVEELATWADNNGHFNGKGSNGTLFDGAARHWNVGKVTKTNNIEVVKQALKDRKPIISYQHAGLFTSGSHFIVLTGIDQQGKIHVNNPNGLLQGQTFDPAQIQQSNEIYYIYE